MIVTDKDFDEVLSNNSLVLMDFWAEWCGPCRTLSPILEELSNETGLLVGKLNVDENPELAQRYSVFSIPTFIIMKNGQVANQFVGAMGKEAFLSEIQKVTNAS